VSTINEIKDQMVTVQSVGGFANAMQQIATMRMAHLRAKVLASRPFVEEAVVMMQELATLQNMMAHKDLYKLDKKHQDEAAKKFHNGRRAVIVITSNQGLTGHYNIEIFQKLEKLLVDEKDADFFVIGKKGQESFATGKYKVQYFPYEVGENFVIEDLKRLIDLFDYYEDIVLLYSRYLNSAKRDVVITSIVKPELEESEEVKRQPGKYIFEPDIFVLSQSIGHKLRGALFQQQIFDSRLAQYSAQMVGMKTASDNAVDLLADLRLEYNKQRRKMIDKKIGEVFAGSALW